MRLKLKKAILDSGAFTLALPFLPSCSLALTKFIIKVYSTVEQYCGLIGFSLGWAAEKPNEICID